MVSLRKLTRNVITVCLGFKYFQFLEGGRSVNFVNSNHFPAFLYNILTFGFCLYGSLDWVQNLLMPFFWPANSFFEIFA